MRFETICILSGAGDELPSSRTLEARGNGLRAPPISIGEAFGKRRVLVRRTPGRSADSDDSRAARVRHTEGRRGGAALIHDLGEAGRKFRLRGHGLVVGGTIAVEAHI